MTFCSHKLCVFQTLVNLLEAKIPAFFSSSFANISLLNLKMQIYPIVVIHGREDDIFDFGLRLFWEHL